MCELKHTYYAYTKVVGLLDATCAHASAGNSLKLDTHTHTHTHTQGPLMWNIVAHHRPYF